MLRIYQGCLHHETGNSPYCPYLGSLTNCSGCSCSRLSLMSSWWPGYFYNRVACFQNIHTCKHTYSKAPSDTCTNRHICLWKPYNVHRHTDRHIDRHTCAHTLKYTCKEWKRGLICQERNLSHCWARACVHNNHNVCFMGSRLPCVSTFMCCVSSLLHVGVHMGAVCVCLGQQTDRRADWPTLPRHLTRHSAGAHSHVAGHLISSTDRLTKHTIIWTRRQIWTKGQTRPRSYTHREKHKSWWQLALFSCELLLTE